jgi:lipid A 3-O-deacylase
MILSRRNLYTMVRTLILIFCLLSASNIRAEIDWVTLVWHNDMFVFRDGGGYTNGAYISLVDLSNEGDGPAKAPPLTRPFLSLIADDPDLTLSVYTLGQAMMTPKDISKPVPDPKDAPYAGLLMLRSSFISVHNNHADTISTSIGMLGPASGAEQVQKFIHKVTDSTDPQGWDYQLKNEPVGQLHFMRTWRFASEDTSPVDALTLAQIGAGNFESSAGTGFILRAGKGLKQSFPSAALITGRIANPLALDGGWYFYFGGNIEYVHNQIFINGNTFRSSPSADLRHESHSLTTGFAYSWRDISISLAFKDGNSLDKNNSSRQQFGAITLGWRI